LFVPVLPSSRRQHGAFSAGKGSGNAFTVRSGVAFSLSYNEEVNHG
jgi:hypothetical protein